jgi:hypothetical protein
MAGKDFTLRATPAAVAAIERLRGTARKSYAALEAELGFLRSGPRARCGALDGDRALARGQEQRPVKVVEGDGEAESRLAVGLIYLHSNRHHRLLARERKHGPRQLHDLTSNELDGPVFGLGFPGHDAAQLCGYGDQDLHVSGGPSALVAFISCRHYGR